HRCEEGVCHGLRPLFLPAGADRPGGAVLYAPLGWPSDRLTGPSPLAHPTSPRPQRQRESKPFAGLTTKPHCDACEPDRAPRPYASSAPPPRLVLTRGRRRQIDTSHHLALQEQLASSRARHDARRTKPLADSLVKTPLYGPLLLSRVCHRCGCSV